MITQAKALDLLSAAASSHGRELAPATLAELVPWLQDPRPPRRLTGRVSRQGWARLDDGERARVLVLNAEHVHRYRWENKP